MGALDQLGRKLLRRLTSSAADYITGSLINNDNDATDEIVGNEVMTGGTAGMNDITPVSGNQAKQNSIVSALKEGGGGAVTDIMKYSNLGTYFDAGADALSNLGAVIQKQSGEQTQQPQQPTEFVAPEIGTVNTGDNALEIKVSQEELNSATPREENKEEESPEGVTGTMNYYSDKVGEAIGTKLIKLKDWITSGEAKDDIKAYGNYFGAMYYGGDSRGETHLDGDIKDDYKLDLQGAVQYYNAVQEGLVAQDVYDEYLQEFYDKYDSYLDEAIKKTGISTESDRKGIMKNDISNAIAANKYINKAYELKPEWRTAEDEKTKQINTALSMSMEKINNAVKYSNLGANAQEFVNDSYSSLQDQYTRMVNAMAPARRVKTNLIKYYGTDDISQYSERDKQTMETIKRAELAFSTFVNNYGDRYSSYTQFANPVDGRIIIPDLVDGVSLHDAIFNGTDFLTEGDYGWTDFLGKGNASAIDVLSNMSANIATSYSSAHGDIINQGWTNLQHFLRPVGVVVSEIGQQTLGRFGIGAYNLTSSIASLWNGGNYGKISFGALNQDNTLLSTLNTNNSATGRLLQKYVSSFMEYTPEIVGNTVDTFWLASLPAKLRNLERFRVLLNSGVWKSVEGLEQSGKTLKNLTAGQRFWRYVASDAVPELVWDQMIDASLSSADTDFGSKMSMIFSLGGTSLGTLSVKMAESGLFRMGKNGLNMIKEASQNVPIKTSWLDGTTWDVLNTLDDKNIDALVKATYNLNSSQLATWEELTRFNKDFRVVSKTIKSAMATLTPQQQATITQAVKGKIGSQLSQLINQVYGSDSQFARRITQLIRDDRTNPADVFKYALGVNGTVEIGGWKSKISLADSGERFVHGYNERLDLIPGFTSNGFGAKLRDGFDAQDLKNLSENGVDWAKNWADNGYFKENNGKYYFTKKGLDAVNDIRTSSLDVQILAKSTESAEQFDNAIRNSRLRKISDRTLQDIKDSGAYDTLADALGELAWLCGIKI